jgi:hypothetical protein
MRLPLTIVAIAAAIATAVLAASGMTLAAGVAAVIAVGFVAEAWRRS